MASKVNKKITIFKPREKQVELLRAWVDPEQKPTVTAVCAKVGIARETYYKWMKNDDFVRWFNDEWKKAMAKAGPYLDNIGLKKAAKDFRYWEALKMQYHGFARKESKEHTMDEEIKALLSKEAKQLSKPSNETSKDKSRSDKGGKGNNSS